MMRFFHQLKRYLLLFGVFTKNCLLTQMEYRLNFFAGIVVESGYLVVKIIYAYFIYQIGMDVQGLSPGAILMFIGTFIMMTGIVMGLFASNFTLLEGAIRSGSLDQMMTLPASLQFMTTMQKVDFGTPLPNIVAGIVMICKGWADMQMPVTIGSVLGFLLFLVIGVVLSYEFFFFPQLIAFWTLHTGGILTVLWELWDLNNIPMKIFPRFLQGIGVFALPLFIITNFPTLFITGQLLWYELAWGLAVPVLLMVLYRILFKRGIRRYHSAGG